MTVAPGGVRERVVRAAEAALAESRFVTVVDVLVRLGWLAPSHVDVWRQGRAPDLETSIQVRPGKLTAALASLREWADSRGLEPSEVGYAARTVDRRVLLLTAGGDPAREHAWRTLWLSPDLSARDREQLLDQASRPPDLVVVSPHHAFTCATCGGSGSLLIMENDSPRCLACAGLDHLVYLQRGNAALSRRAKAASGLSAIVVRFSRTRKRYERQGTLVEQVALEAAEAQCRADAEARERRRQGSEARPFRRPRS